MKNDSSASFDLAPTDVPLPETVAVLPSSASGETPSVAVAMADTPAVPNTSDAVSAAEATAVAADSAVEATDVPVMAMAATATPAKVPLPLPKAVALADEPALANTAAGLATPAEDKGVVVHALAKASDVVETVFTPASYAKSNNPRGQLDQLIAKYAAIYEVPIDLVRRVVKRESNFNPAAFNHGHYGLMQIKHATARGMGYQGSAKGLFNAETNLKYAVKYLRGAYMVADGNHDRADRLYQTGYYYHAKRKGLLDETGLGRDRVRRRQNSLPES
jgi:soluble lytic murein transglycosylase-like protein